MNLKTERISFHPYTEESEPEFISLMTDPAVMKHVGDGVLSETSARSLWRKLLFEMYPSGSDTIWRMSAVPDGRYIGHASIRPRPEHPDDWEIGYILKGEVWGKGLATEAARALVAFGFERLGLNEVFATVDDDNSASIRVLEKAGFKFLRFDFDDRGRYSVYSILPKQSGTRT